MHNIIYRIHRTDHRFRQSAENCSWKLRLFDVLLLLPHSKSSRIIYQSTVEIKSDTMPMVVEHLFIQNMSWIFVPFSLKHIYFISYWISSHFQTCNLLLAIEFHFFRIIIYFIEKKKTLILIYTNGDSFSLMNQYRFT